MSEVLNLANKREVFWDDYLVDRDRTTATHRIHQPRETEDRFYLNGPCRVNHSTYGSLVKEPDGLIRLYYTGTEILDMNPGEKVHFGRTCFYYAESRDGINWVKPNLGIVEYDGSRDNNMFIDGRESLFDNIYVFRDGNPDCPAEERYKALIGMHPELWCYTSSDGLHFEKGWVVSRSGTFDSSNTAMWDPEKKLYHCFFRGFHAEVEGGDTNIRDIRYMYSKDFREWSEPVFLDFMGKDDYALYTNCISAYERAPQILVGFPTRYVERKEWTPNYDRLCGAELRRHKMIWVPRVGLAVTDCAFMFSRDGKTWCRYDESFIDPGPENGENWIYGDAYPATGLFETPGLRVGSETELSLLNKVYDGKWKEPLYIRYALRKDGFVSLNAPYAGAVVTTKPFTFDGKGIAMNFSTSAIGYLYITLTAEDGTVAKSCEIFGDSCDRIIDFDTDLSAFAGKKTVMEIKMRDADIYSVKFD